MTLALEYLIVGCALLLGIVLPRLTANRAISPPIILVALGALLGLLPLPRPALDPIEHHMLVEHVSELTILIALTGVGLALDRPLSLARVTWRRWSTTWRLLFVAMPLAIAAMTLLGHVLMGLGAASALLLASALAPTDPVLASDVQVEGPTTDVDEHEIDENDEVRFALTSEAGLNDGAAFPFVAAAVLLANGDSVDLHWLGVDLIGRTVIGVLVGYAVGWVLVKVAFRAPRALNVSHIGDPLLIVCCPLIAYGAGEMLHGWAFLSVFVSALTMRAGDRSHAYHEEMHAVADRLETLLTLIILLVLGASLTNGLLDQLTWQGALIGVLLVLVVRPVIAWAALWSRRGSDLRNDGRLGSRERLVTAFFGVRGVGTIYYLAWAGSRAQFPHFDQVWSAAGFAIAFSVVVHGVTASPIVGRLDRLRAHSV